MEKKSKKNIIIGITSLFLAAILLTGLTYAYYRTRIIGNESTDPTIDVTTELYELVYSDGTSAITKTDLEPITTDKVLSTAKTKTFTLNKTAESGDVYATIKLTDINISDNFAKYDLKWALYKGTEPISTGDFGGKNGEEIVAATNQYINSTTPVEYHIYIWINETGLNQNDMMGGTLSARIEISGVNKKMNTLANAILGENNSNVIIKEPTFSSTSTDKGLFVEQGNKEKSEMGFATYYYRGSVTNNYVQFGTHNHIVKNIKYVNDVATEIQVANVGDPILWRIVRINEDGSIRLVSEHNITHETHMFNDGSKSLDNPVYINNYGTNNESNSQAKTKVEDWLFANFIMNNFGLDSKIVISSFCNDVSGYDLTKPYGQQTDPTNAEKRLAIGTPNPIFTCPAGAINAYSKIGLLTGDEMIYAGALFQQTVENNTTYLQNNAYFWTLTPGEAPQKILTWGPKGGGDIGSRSLDQGTSATARVVINVSPDVVLDSNTTYIQDGTIDKPYVIK